MHETAFDALTRHASSAYDRRASLKALGAAAMVAALAAPQAADAGKSSNKSKKLCKKQVSACKDGWDKACGGDQTCLSLATCCSFLKNCDAAGQIKCITDIL
jgi:hypothetical protein